MSKDNAKQIEGSRLIRLPEVLDIIPISERTWWEGVREGQFPQPVKLGEHLPCCWRKDDILKLKENTEYICVNVLEVIG